VFILPNIDVNINETPFVLANWIKTDGNEFQIFFIDTSKQSLSKVIPAGQVRYKQTSGKIAGLKRIENEDVIEELQQVVSIVRLNVFNAFLCLKDIGSEQFLVYGHRRW
jgi:hypothetical protein